MLCQLSYAHPRSTVGHKYTGNLRRQSMLRPTRRRRSHKQDIGEGHNAPSRIMGIIVVQQRALATGTIDGPQGSIDTIDPADTPLILVGKMWAELVDWSRRSMLRKGIELASEIDFTIPHCVNTIDETVALIRENRAAWLAAQPLRNSRHESPFR